VSFVPNSPKFNEISNKDSHCSETEFLVMITIKMTTLYIVTPYNPLWWAFAFFYRITISKTSRDTNSTNLQD